jgi:hypothetical protein
MWAANMVPVKAVDKFAIPAMDTGLIPAYFTMNFVCWLISVGKLDPRSVEPQHIYRVMRYPKMGFRLNNGPILVHENGDESEEQRASLLEFMQRGYTQFVGMNLRMDFQRRSAKAGENRQVVYSLNEDIAANYEKSPSETWIRTDMARCYVHCGGEYVRR